MLPGPIFRYELKAAGRSHRMFVVRTVLGLLLASVMILSAGLARGWQVLTTDVYDPEQLFAYGGSVLIASLVVELLFVMPLMITTVGPAIAKEREKETLILLLLTRLSRVENVLTKMIARLIPPLSLLLAGFPFAAACAWCARLPLVVFVETMAMVTSTVVVVGGFSILASAWRDRVGSARAQAMTWAFLWFLFIPICSIIPVQSTTIWGALAVEIKRLCSWIAMSSPISLATDNAWFGAGVAALSKQIRLMIGLQSAIIVLAVVGAASGLRIRDRHAFSWDAYHGYRPPVGDDPVFWREHTLPFRGAKQPLIVAQVRHIAILLRLLLRTLLQLVVMALSVAVPIAIAIGTARYGYFAFAELARDGYFPAGPTPGRDEFNYLIRVVTGVLGLAPLLALSAMTAARITIERDKKTWESLLVTPLTGSEILSSKMRVSGRGFWRSARWLIPVWLLGILAGSVHPLTAFLAATELPLASWASLAVGAWLGVRTGSTATANSQASLASLGFGAFVALGVLALLCSQRELMEFATLDVRLRAVVIAFVLASPPILGFIAWSLTRRTFHRFDEWVGRPCRSRGLSAPSGLEESTVTDHLERPNRDFGNKSVT